MSNLTWSEDSSSGMRLHHGDLEVAVLATGIDIPVTDSPKPHIHPLRTPGGVVVTGYAPPDHTWHHGLMFAVPRVNDHNLWGGNTYVDPERGYEMVENQGGIRHLAWEARVRGDTASVTESLRWEGHDGTALLTERRTWRFVAVDSPAAHVVDLDTTLTAVTSSDVSLETPAQRGRPDGGYGGLFLRLADGFVADGIFGEPGTDVSSSGGTSDTLVVHGTTQRGDAITIGLSFVDGPTPGPRVWLHRFEPFAAIGWAVAYTDGLTVPHNGSLTFQHRLAILDGHVDPVNVRALLTIET